MSCRPYAGGAALGLAAGIGFSIPDSYAYVLFLYLLTAYLWEPYVTRGPCPPSCD